MRVPSSFEIARSEIGYTDQRPAEYATNILAAAIAEGWRGPVFIQGDHFQLSPKKYAADPQRRSRRFAIWRRRRCRPGSTISTLTPPPSWMSRSPACRNSRRPMFGLSSDFAAFIRGLEPAGVTISIGGEIGEVGGHNSTAEELRAFMDGFNAAIKKQAPWQAGPEQDQHPDRHIAWRHRPAKRHPGSSQHRLSTLLRSSPRWPRRIRTGRRRAARSLNASGRRISQVRGERGR